MKGDALVPFHRIEHLSARHEITLVSFYEDDAELEHADWLRDVCADVQLVGLPRWRAIANVASRALFSQTPLQILYYGSAEYAARVREVARDRSFDVVHAFTLRVSPYVEPVGRPTLLEAVDSMTLRMQRNVEVERAPRRWLYAEERRRVGAFERSCVTEVVVAAREDAAYFPRASVHVIPNGVDPDMFSPASRLAEVPTIVFSGTMSYPPNVRAVRWFANNCFPRIRERVPDARFVIAGKAPTREVTRLDAREGVTVTGFVDSMPQVLRRARVAVAPMLSGAGIQNKVLEAMACGLPVVATPYAAAAIDAVAGRDLVVAEGSDAFIASVVELLEDSAGAGAIGARAREAVVAHHGWGAAAGQIERLYESLATLDH
jgi:polysaccharide biosynthesis protein PslH